MKNYFVILAFMSLGCASSMVETMTQVRRQYNAVLVEDGIDREEAKIIAQNALIKANMVRIYDLANPHFSEDIEQFPGYEKYWFVEFEERQTDSIPFVFIAVVNRETGKIKFAGDYARGREWIVEAEIRR